MDEDIFSAHGESLEEVVLLMLGMRHMTLASAESCTGGMLAQRLTAIPGSSRYFLGGAVVYADALKTTFADVSPDLIAEKAPSPSPPPAPSPKASASAPAPRSASAITGIAGPGPGTGADTGKPIGLVYIAIASDEGTQVKELNLQGDRERIRTWSTLQALELIRRQLL